jgi:hypothetical protein
MDLKFAEEKKEVVDAGVFISPCGCIYSWW